MAPATKACRTCGKPMSTAPGNLDCNSCRYKARPATTRDCRICGESFTSKATGRMCSGCKNARLPKDPCPKCGQPKDKRAKHCIDCRELPETRAPMPDHMKGPRFTLADVVERALASTVRYGDGCTLVTEWKPQPKGYVRGPRVDDRSPQMIHRLVVEHRLGRRLTDDETVDHTCHNRDAARGWCAGGVDCPHRRCINPDHLELVDAVENWSRGTRGVVRERREKKFCPAGHPYEGANLLITPKGYRTCRACKRARSAGRNPKMEVAIV